MELDPKLELKHLLLNLFFPIIHIIFETPVFLQTIQTKQAPVIVNESWGTALSPTAISCGLAHSRMCNANEWARRAGSDGIMSASGSAGPGFDPRRGSKFSFGNFSSSGLGGVEMYTF